MSRPVLVVPRAALPDLPVEGVWPLAGALDTLPHRFLPRADAETDERYRQIIPYGLLRDGVGRLWCYQRLGGDPRVLSRHSCGVGGHIEPDDMADTLSVMCARALWRELAEELANAPEPFPLTPAAWLYEGHSAIGRVHLGVIYRLDWPLAGAPVPAAGEPLHGLGFHAPETIAADPRFELWSRLAADWSAQDPAGPAS